MLKWTVERTLWPSPHSLAWQWYVMVQAEMKLRMLERALQRHASPDSVRYIQRYLHSDIASAVGVARHALSPCERHNCCTMLRWSMPHAARKLWLHEEAITGVGLRYSWEEYDHPRLVMWNQGRFLGYVQDEGDVPTSWWIALRKNVS